MLLQKKYTKLFILEQCLQFGHLTKYTNKKLNKYIFITKGKNEIFNLYDLRAMILKLYPLINALFYKHNYHYQPNFRYFTNKAAWYHLEKKNYRGVQILFATTTKRLTYIVEDAANLCNMPFSTGRWLNGSLTASLTKKIINWKFIKKVKWDVTTITKLKHIKDMGIHKQNFSLIILPDPQNNKMIWREAKKKNIPILGLLSSSCDLDINYGIFGDHRSPYVVCFFCNLLADLILKENVFCKYRQNINSSVQLQTLSFYQNLQTEEVQREKENKLAQHFFKYFRTTIFENRYKQHWAHVFSKYNRLLAKFCYYFQTNTNTHKIPQKLIKPLSFFLKNKRFSSPVKIGTKQFPWVFPSKKKINISWLYSVWQKRWPFRPWSGLRYYGELSLFFVQFRQTKWSFFWKNRGYVLRKAIKTKKKDLHDIRDSKKKDRSLHYSKIMYIPNSKQQKTLTSAKPLYKKNNYQPKLLLPSKWQTKLTSPYTYQKKDIKRKTLPSWLVRSVTKNFSESKTPWSAYYNLPERSARQRKHRSYRYRIQRWYKRKSKKWNRKKVYSLFGFTNYVYRMLDRTQYPRTNLLRHKIYLHRRWHNTMVKLRLRLPNELCDLLRPWQYNYLPPTLLRDYIKQRYKRFYKVVGTDTKYKLKFLRTFKGDLLKNSAIKKLSYIWKKLLWYRKRNHRKERRIIKFRRAWLSTLWRYRTSIFYNQLVFYKKKK